MIPFPLILIIYFLIWLFRLPYVLKCLNTRKRTKRSGYVYAFTDIGQLLPLVKIGLASDDTGRLLSHKTAAPLGIVVFYNTRVIDRVHAERTLHGLNPLTRIKNLTLGKINNEWFILTPDMVLDICVIRLYGDFSLRSFNICLLIIFHYCVKLYLLYHLGKAIYQYVFIV